MFRHYPLFASAVGSRPPFGAVSVFWRRRQLITNVYIDGFNLYYRALKDTPFRWLDLHKLAETLFPEGAQGIWSILRPTQGVSGRVT